jgi:nucleoid DNA-binding protein
LGGVLNLTIASKKPTKQKVFMVVLSEELAKQKQVPKDEVDIALEKLFTGVEKAIKEYDRQKVSIEKVDAALDALFDAINRSPYEGNNLKIPDFKRILTGEF